MSRKVVRLGTLEQKCDALVDFVWQYLNEHGEPPSQREICAALRTSPNVLQEVIRYAVEQGRVIHRPGCHRGIWVRTG